MPRIAPGPAQDRESGRSCTESFAANAKARACGLSFIVRSVGVFTRSIHLLGEPPSVRCAVRHVVLDLLLSAKPRFTTRVALSDVRGCLWPRVSRARAIRTRT